MTFICENCLHLRQCLHPESAKKSLIPLPNYYWSYFDLRLEFQYKYQTTQYNNLNSMLESNSGKIKFHLYIIFFHIYIELNISPISEIDYCMRNIKHMELIIYQMLNDGKFI